MRANSLQKNPAAWPDERRLERWLRKLKRRAAWMSFQAFPQLSRAVLAMEASRLSPAAEATFFSRDLREIPPTLNEDLLDLYGRSEQVLANLFAFHNVSEALDGDFNWEMHESAAWRRELHSFDYALSLGMTYRISQEARYARHLRYLISHWIATNPPESSVGWEPGTLARRVRNWILAWDLAHPAWQDGAEFHDVFWQSLAMQCVYLGRHAALAASLVEAVQCARALHAAARAFGKSGAEFAGTARSLLAGAVKSLSHRGPDGEFPRPIELYELAEACLEQIVFAPPADHGAESSDFGAARGILALLEGTLVPDGTLPMFGPAARSKVDELSDLYALAAVVLNEPRWKNLAGKFGILPYLILGERGKLQFEQMAVEPWDSGSRAIPDLGLFRLGGGNHSAMVINARPAIEPQDHQDFLSYELYVEGLRVVVDSGPYSPEGETWNKYYSSAAAHNVLLVDGYPPGIGPASRRSFENGAPSPLLETDAGLRSCHEAFYSPGIRCHRAFFSLGGAAWAVVDWLTGEGRHQVMNLIHFFPTFAVEVRGDHALARSRSLSVTILPFGFAAQPGPTDSILRTWRGPGTQFQGLYSPDFGVKFPSAVVAVSSDEINLPWIGGYVVARGTGLDMVIGEADPAKGSLSIGLSGKSYQLTIS